MSKNIWHNWLEKPDGDKFIIEKYLVPWGGKEINQYDLYCCDDGQIDYRSAWCYLDELLALESELDRTRKALDVAVDALKKLEEKAYLTEYAQGIIAKALKEITAILENKNGKC